MLLGILRCLVLIDGCHQPTTSSLPQVMKDFVQLKQIEDVLDKGLAVKHSKLSQLTEEVITDPAKVNGAWERI